MTLFDHDYQKFPELTNSQLQEFQFSSPHPQIVEDFDAEVVRVHDGDTITLRTQSRDFDFPLRILDIDAPEMNAGGKTARDWLRNRISGKQIRVLIDRYNRVGKYGRLLGQILHGGTNIGQEEVRLGLAKPFGNKDEGEIPNMNKLFRLRQWV